jgi:TatD DNase family protein
MTLHAHPAPPDLVDIGANLTHESFASDLSAVLARASRAGVHRLLVTGADPEGSTAALALARAHPGRLWATAGVHPHHAAQYDAEVEEHLARLHTDPLVLAVGECGLDYFRDLSPRPTQQFAFERQIALAQRCGKPLFLHQRDAHADFMAVLKAAGALPPLVVHCFTGTADELRDYVDAGWYVGITGWICDERRGSHLKEAVRLIPADRLLLETDAPYLMPRTLRPRPDTRRNEPQWLPEVLHTVAEARGESPARLAEITSANAEKLFRMHLV